MRSEGRFAIALEELRSPRAFNVQATALLLPISIYYAWVSYAIAFDYSTRIAITAGVVGWFAIAAALTTARALLFANGVTRRSLKAVVVAFMVAAAVRSLAVSGTVAALTGFALTPNFVLQRLVASVPQLTATTLAVAIFTVSIAELRDRWRQAAAARAQRADLQAESQRRVREDVEDFSHLIADRLLPLVDRIESQLGGTQGETRLLAAEVREMCEVEVREVSHQLAAEPTPIRLADHLPQRPSFSWAVRRSFDETRFYLGWAYVVISILAVPSATVRAGLGSVGWLLAVFTVSAAIGMSLAALPWPRVLRRAPGAAVTQLSLALSLGAFTHWLLRQSPFFDGSSANVPTSVWLYLSLAVFVWVGLNLIGGSIRAAEAAIAAVTEDSEALALDVARLRKAHAKVRKQQAQILHGPVQGRLSAVSMALTMHSQDPEGGWLEQARDQLEGARISLRQALSPSSALESNATQSSVPLADRLHAVAQEWRGLLDVMVSVDPECESAMQAEPAASEEIVEAVQECLVNSVRHGKARRASVFVGSDRDDRGSLITVEVMDDGQATEPNQGGDGLGARFLEASGARRELIRTATGTRVRIEWRRLTEAR